MFGRDLTEQVRADAQGGDRMVPIIVEKCIEAVEANGKPFYHPALEEVSIIFFWF
jgi:hypothetical protein